MSDLSDYSELLLLNWLLGGTGSPPAPPANLFLAIHTGAPGETGAANEVTVGQIALYVRQAISFGTASAGQAVSSNQQNFTSASGDSAVTVSHVSIWDAATVGNCVWQGEMSIARTLNPGGTLSFATGDVVCELD